MAAPDNSFKLTWAKSRLNGLTYAPNIRWPWAVLAQGLAKRYRQPLASYRGIRCMALSIDFTACLTTHRVAVCLVDMRCPLFRAHDQEP
jgi:hypothetical protein